MFHYVYQIISMTPNEDGVCRIYSGLRSCECEPEEDTRYMGSGHAIRGAIEKYGREKFMKIIIAKFSTREEAHSCETQWLEKQFNFHGRDWSRFRRFNYNLRLNENSRDGFSRSPETRSKQSDAMTGKMVGEKNPFFGKQHSEETKQKISDALTGKMVAENHPNFGKPMSEEQKQKISDALTGKMVAENHPNFGKPMSEEQKQKISDALTGKMVGKNHPQFKGLSIGTKDNQTIVFCGNADMKSRGFTQAHISAVILGKRTHHKGFTFIRTADPDKLNELLNTATFYDDVSKEIIEEFLQD